MGRRLWTGVAVAATLLGVAVFAASPRVIGQASAQGALNRCECSPPTKLESGGVIYHCACGNLYCAVIGPGQQQPALACK